MSSLAKKKSKQKKNTNTTGTKNLNSKSPNQSPIASWCANACRSADGNATLRGMASLGPISSFNDLLLPSNSNPQTTLAAEQLIHLIEGWRYAASATNAMLSHASDQAIHFAYYAELRAAMSLFSWSGIRVKQNDYYYLDAQGNKNKLANQRTHPAVWGLWEEWVTRPDAQSLLSDSIRLHPTVTLGDVIGSIRYTDASSALKFWGWDLLNSTRDHNARNVASYEARLASKPLVVMKKEDVDLVIDLWRLFLSDGPSLQFDSALVNFIVAESVPKIINQSLKQPKPTELEQLAEIASYIAAQTGTNEEEILRRLDFSAHSFQPFRMAADKTTNVQNVLCRCYFLLRMAMLATNMSMSKTPSNSAKKWMENWLQCVGIWNPGKGIELIDIEEDYRNSVAEFDPKPPFPSSLWEPEKTVFLARLVHPEACMAWGLIA